MHLLVRLDLRPLKLSLPLAKSVCEIQLRTILQDAWAEVEHELVYKSPVSLPKESVKRKLAALNATLALSDLIFQELRDHQREICRRNQKRRSTLSPSLPLPEVPWAAEPSELSAPASDPPPLPAPATGAGSRLERALLEALDAHSRNELEQAIVLYAKVLEMRLERPIRALVYNHRGMARFGLGRYREALRDFSRALQFDPGNDRVFANRALTLRLLTRPGEALTDYDRAVEIAPSRLENYWGRAQLCFEMGLLVRALADCEKALNIQDDFAPARQLAGELRRRLG